MDMNKPYNDIDRLLRTALPKTETPDAQLLQKVKYFEFMEETNVKRPKTFGQETNMRRPKPLKRTAAILVAAVVAVIASGVALATSIGWITIGTPGDGGFVTDEAGLAEIIEANPELQDLTREDAIAELERAASMANREMMSAEDVSAAVTRYGIDLSEPGWTVSQAIIMPESLQQFPFQMDIEPYDTNEELLVDVPANSVFSAFEMIESETDFELSFDEYRFLRTMIPVDAPIYHVYCEILGLDLTFQPIPDNGWMTLSRTDNNTGAWQMIRVYRDAVAVVASGR